MILNHLLQSTLFAAFAALLTLGFRKNRAQIRYALWLAASVKFLIPFSILIAIGSHFGIRTLPAVAQSGLSSVIEQVSQPFAAPVPVPAPQPAPTNWFPATLAVIWIIGFAFVVSNWYRRWRILRAAVRIATPLPVPIALEALTSPNFPEPGVYGIFRPILLLPAGIADRLTPLQFEAILAHELCHIHRRDNLATAFHMAVEAIFWFHPLVWWLGARLMEERERACDEEVLRQGAEPHVYAEGILKICELYLESPLPGISGITGANLRQRIEAIMANRIALPLSRVRATLLAAAATAALATPFVVGILNAPVLIAESAAPLAAQPAPANIPKFRSVFIKLCRPRFAPSQTGFVASPPGTLNSTCAPLAIFINTAYVLYENGYFHDPSSVVARPFISGGPIWISMAPFYQINATAIGTPTEETMRGPMLQALLESRFRVKIHREIKEVEMYVLTVAPGGPKLKAVPDGTCAPVRSLGSQFLMAPPPPPPPPPPTSKSVPAPPPPPPSSCGVFSGNTGPLTPSELKASALIANGADLNTIAEHLASVIGRPVIDKTGLKGSFSFHIKFANDDTLSGPLSSDTVFTVLKKQLGLKLEPTTGPREFIYIDHAEKPRQE